MRNSTLHTLMEKSRIEKIKIEGCDEPFYISRNLQEYMKCENPNNYVRFIAPLDNIMWDRQMVETIFDFTYRWEVYTPVAKRKFGYYVLPVLYNGRFVARFESEPVRKAGEFVIKNWWWEPEIEPDDDMIEMIDSQLKCFAEFLQTNNAANNIKKLGGN